MTVRILSQTSAFLDADRTSTASPRENAVPFLGLVFYTFILFIAPQAFFTSLAPLRIAMLSAGLAAGAYIVDRLRTRQPLTVAMPETRLVAVFIFIALASIPLAASPGGSLGYFLDTFLKNLIMFFLIANLLSTLERLKLLLALIVLAGVIYAVTVLYNSATGHMMVSRSEFDRPWGYPSPLAMNPDGLGLILNVILSLAAGLYLVARRRVVKAALALGIGLMLAGIIVSFSRGAFLALAVVLSVLLAKSVRAQGPVVLLPASALVVLGVLLLPAGYADRLYSLVDPTLDRVGSISQRSQEVQVAAGFILENPVIGAGVGMDGLAFVEAGLGYGWTTHNIFLRVGVELGLPGMLVYALLFFRVLSGLRYTQRRLGPVAQAGEVGAIAFGLELAIWSYLIGAFFLPVSYDPTFPYLAGMASATRVIDAQLTGAPERTQ